MTAAQNFLEIGFPVPRGPAPPAYRRGVDWRAYRFSSLNVAYGQEADVQFVLGGVTWPAAVITSTAYSEEREQYKEYFWIDRQKNPGLPWPPDRNLESDAAPIIRPAQMVIPYGLDVALIPIASTCTVNNFLAPFAYWRGASEDIRQCTWHVTEVPPPPKFVGEAPALEPEFLDELTENWLDTPRRNSTDPVPVEIEGEWADIVRYRLFSSADNPSLWRNFQGRVDASSRYRIARFVFQTTGPEPEDPQPVETNVRRLRIGIRTPDQGNSDIDWLEKILPDQFPLITELRVLVPPSDHAWVVECEAWIPRLPTNANVTGGIASSSIITVSRSLTWHDRAVWTRVGSANAPVIRMRGRSVRVPDRSTVDGDGIVVPPDGWRFPFNLAPGRVAGMKEVRCADPVWIIADVLTRSVYEYNPSTDIDWESFVQAGIDNEVPVNLSLTAQPSPLETLAPILAQTGLRLHQRNNVWQFRRGLRMLLGSRQIVEPITTQTPLVRTPQTVQITWGETGFAQIRRTQYETENQPQPVPVASGIDVLPWTQDQTDALRFAREALWPRQDPTMQLSVGPWGQLLEPGDIVAVSPNAPSVVGRREGFLGDDSINVTLSTPQSTLRRVLFTTGKESVSSVTEGEELPDGTFRLIRPSPGEVPTLRGAIVPSSVREWEVLSVRKRNSLVWDLVLEASPDPARAAWIDSGDEGCQLIDSWTRQMDDWPLIDSCVGFS